MTVKQIRLEASSSSTPHEGHSRTAIGPVTAAIRAMQECVDEPVDQELINAAGDVIGVFGIGVMRFSRPAAKRRSWHPIGHINVGMHGVLARLYVHNAEGRDLGRFGSATEATQAVLAHAIPK